MLTLLSLLAMACLGMIHLDLFARLWEILPNWVSRLLQPVLFIFSSLVVVLAAVLLSSAFGLLRRPPLKSAESQPPRLTSPWRKVWHISLATLLLLTLAYVTYWESVWDQTSDGLGGLWLAYQASLAAVICGAVMGIKAQSWFRSAGFFFALLTPVLILGAFRMGWNADYQAITRQRADKITAALTRFQIREGQYPDHLEALVPGYLHWIPSQVILRHEEWCYQGGGNAYVLAAYWRKYFGTPLEVKVYASNGCLVSSLEKACQSRLPALKQRYDPRQPYEQ
jgi:hypothetical protein